MYIERVEIWCDGTGRISYEDIIGFSDVQVLAINHDRHLALNFHADPCHRSLESLSSQNHRKEAQWIQQTTELSDDIHPMNLMKSKVIKIPEIW